ncbi:MULTISPECIES: FMN-binding protein [unclassified Bradyrhizobium]|uniref:FMN-binding protein n=1 Tax=unclassified Bradyrhizobium TaxID=2631580 RepID=UPI001FFA62A3|nr:MULTISPECIES: FMN-binding protein [unclassified Bradyrhizobium]MCK1708342.1 FMN-binding protein [Bradyrhizobium sp. 143]MCK1724194.1 FMN-binding protein [Bradyrhizobium sp. 142]
MKWTPILAAPAAIVLVAPAKANVYLSEQQAMQAIFPGASFSSGGRPGLFRASSGGIVVIDRVLGKHEYIKYAVGITAGGMVKQIEILEYNESYGYEVREASWRSQFVGKSASSPLQLNVDIKNISGATLSCKHITDGVRRIVGQFQSLKGG